MSRVQIPSLAPSFRFAEIPVPILAREKFDLVITNFLMPEMGGVVIQTLHRLHPPTRILAMSRGGRNPPRLFLTIAAGIGAQKLLTKPFPPAELLDAVRERLAEGRLSHSMDRNRISRPVPADR